MGGNNTVNLVTSRKINTRLARPIRITPNRFSKGTVLVLQSSNSLSEEIYQYNHMFEKQVKV